jgi:hypothetical protein
VQGVQVKRVSDAGQSHLADLGRFSAILDSRIAIGARFPSTSQPASTKSEHLLTVSGAWRHDLACFCAQMDLGAIALVSDENYCRDVLIVI